MPSEACLEEFEALTAIFLDEIKIDDEQKNGDTTVSMVLYPSTGDDRESKYVTLTLEITLPKEYPKVSPKIRFRNPRGLSESMLDTLNRRLNECCAERLESQMIFELFDMGKEFLTINNRPASECPICLLSFTQCDTFFRSQCFHHFHSNCLGRYLQNVMQVAASEEHLPGEAPGKTCPVCREVLDEDIDIQKLLDSPLPFEESLEVADGDAILKEWHGKQEKLQPLFDKQKSQGGIIDLSEIDKKRLVISSPRGPTDSDSPSATPDLSSEGDGDLVVSQRHGAGGTGSAHIPSNCNPRNKARGKSAHKDKSTACRPVTQNCPREVKQMVSSKPVQPPPDSVGTTKTSPTLGRHGMRHSGRGKGGHSGHNRRRYK